VPYTFVQANLLCTRTGAKKVTVVLALVSVPVRWALAYIKDLHSHFAVFVTVRVVYFGLYVVLPVAVLVVNVALIREVRRAFNNAAANLGLHHPSTSSHSAVPTITIITTSLVYVLLRGSVSITYLIGEFAGFSVALRLCNSIADALSRFVFAYNFYVYMITGRQFRSELQALFDCCIISSSTFRRTSAAAAATTTAATRGRSDARGQAETAI